MKAVTKNLWAPIIRTSLGKEWISWTDVRTTRKASKAAYLEGLHEKFHADHLKNVRFGKVTITEN